MSELPPALHPAARVTLAPSTFDRSSLQPLFLLADDSEAAVAAVRDRGDLYLLTLGPDRDDVVGLVLVHGSDGPEPELVNVAVAEELQGQGLGGFLVRSVLLQLAATGARRVTLFTAAADLDALGFYQQLGFRLCGVVRDWFTEARGYPPGLAVRGVPVRDRVDLDLALGARWDPRSPWG